MRALLVSLLLALHAVGPVAHAGYERGDKMKVSISDVRPTQSDVGMHEVRIRVSEIESLKNDKKALKELMKDYRAMVVVGPEERLYLVDGHHFSRTLHEAGIEEMYIRIERDWSDKKVPKFWEKMREKGWVYLRDQSGKTRTPSELPKRIAKMGDDPYRSLAWLVRKAKGYKNLDVPFQEFQWADFFRDRIPRSLLSDEAGFQEAIDQALKLARGADAAKLPGYLGLKAASSCNVTKLLLQLSR